MKSNGGNVGVNRRILNLKVSGHLTLRLLQPPTNILYIHWIGGWLRTKNLTWFIMASGKENLLNIQAKLKLRLLSGSTCRVFAYEHLCSVSSRGAKEIKQSNLEALPNFLIRSVA